MNAAKYRLSINVKVNGLSLLILEDKNVIMALNFQWQETNWKDCSINIEQIIKDNGFISYNYKTTDIFIESAQSAIVPKEFFMGINSQTFLNAYIGNEDYVAVSQDIKKEKAVLIFGIHKLLKASLLKSLSRAKFHHCTAIIINNALDKNSTGSNIILKVRSSFFEVVSVTDGKLLAYNNFTYKTIDEFMFLLLGFAKQQKQDITKSKLILSEELLMESKIASQLNLFFPNIEKYINSAINKNEEPFTLLKNNTIIANS